MISIAPVPPGTQPRHDDVRVHDETEKEAPATASGPIHNANERLERVDDGFKADIAAAETKAAEAQAALDDAKAAAIARQNALDELNRKRAALQDRIAMCSRDFDAEIAEHEHIIERFFGRRDLSQNEESRLSVAVVSLGDLPGLKRVVPSMRKKLAKELAKLDEEIAAVKP